MSTNCVRCVKNRRTGSDLLCDDCRKLEYQYCKYFKGNPAYFWCPVGNRGVIMEPSSFCYDCPRYQDKQHLTSRRSRAADSCACKDGGLFDFGNSNICINCGGTIPPPA